jgi:hypothetical protein
MAQRLPTIYLHNPESVEQQPCSCGKDHAYVPAESIVAARRDLAKKALAAIDELWIDTRFDGQWRNGFQQCKSEALREMRRLFAAEGVAVEGG